MGRVKSKIMANRKATIYTDAGYSLNSSYGRLAFKIDRRKTRIKLVEVPKISYLRQYTNLLELWAVAEALKHTKSKWIKLLTDSRCIVSWVKREKNNLNRFSEYHFQKKAEIDKRKAELEFFEIEWIAREKNLAGKALENSAQKSRS